MCLKGYLKVHSKPIYFSASAKALKVFADDFEVISESFQKVVFSLGTSVPSRFLVVNSYERSALRRKL